MTGTSSSAASALTAMDETCGDRRESTWRSRLSAPSITLALSRPMRCERPPASTTPAISDFVSENSAIILPRRFRHTGTRGSDSCAIGDRWRLASR
ncbi:hypothetical protein RHECNPAF_6420043 [Rhizobium etli CNPAF512]|nr:hypothetical protein RHECNPAF_6420043 [Rhizobium etli CNPAF512]